MKTRDEREMRNDERETRSLKNMLIFIQTILTFVLSRKIIKINRPVPNTSETFLSGRISARIFSLFCLTRNIWFSHPNLEEVLLCWPHQRILAKVYWPQYFISLQWYHLTSLLLRIGNTLAGCYIIVTLGWLNYGY